MEEADVEEIEGDCPVYDVDEDTAAPEEKDAGAEDKIAVPWAVP